jgi:hypothetical protein
MAAKTPKAPTVDIPKRTLSAAADEDEAVAAAEVDEVPAR